MDLQGIRLLQYIQKHIHAWVFVHENKQEYYAHRQARTDIHKLLHSPITYTFYVSKK